MFAWDAGREDIIEMRVVLYSGGKPWGETWVVTNRDSNHRETT